MAIDDRGVNLRVTADATEVRQGFNEVKTAAKDMAQSVATEGAKAGKAIDGIGNGGNNASKNLARSTGSMTSSIQRLTAELTAGEKGTRQYFETMADFRGIPRAAIEPSLKALDEVRSKQSLANSALAGGAIAFDKYGMSAKQTAAAMRGVPAQLTDIMVSLQGGQAPMTVLLQQGGQLKDMFGGIVPAVRALGAGLMALVNPFTLAAGAVAGLYTVFRMGANESEAFNNTLILTGNAVGLSAAQLQDMAARLDGVVGTQRNASAALNEFAKSTKIGSGNLEEFATAAIRWEKATGTAVSETVKQFEELGKDPLKASLKLNESMNFLTDSVREQIKALQDQGRETDAAAIAQQTFADTINERAPQILDNVGLIEKAWRGVKSAVAEAIDTMAGIGREQTTTDLLAAEYEKLGQMEGLQGLGSIDLFGSVEQQRQVVRALEEQLSLEGSIATIQRQSEADRRSRLERERNLDAYTSDPSRMSRAEQEQKAVQEEMALYEARKKDAQGNAAALQAIETAHQTAMVSIKDKYKEKKAPKSEAQKELERQQKAEIKAVEDFAKAREKALAGQYADIGAIEDRTRKLRDEIDTYGMGKAAIEAMAISRLEEQAAVLKGFDGSEEQIAIIEREIEARKRLMSATGEKEALDANRKAAEQAAKEWVRTTEQIGQSLTDALLRGFESGKSFAENFRDTLKNMFKTMILQPIIQPVMTSVAGSVQGLLGMGQQAGGADMLGTASNLNSAYNAFSGGMTSKLSNGIGWLGEKFGSSAMQSFAAGMTGFVPSLSGLAAGGGLAASLGTGAAGSLATGMATTSFSASLGAAGGAAGMGAAFASAIPYIGAGLAVASLIGGDLFGGGPPKTRHSQRTTAELYGGNFNITQRDGRQAGGADVAAASFAQTSVAAANELFKKIGVDAAIDSFYAIMESSVLGDRDGVASGGALRSGGKTVNFGIKQASDMTLAGFGGWSDAEMLPRLQTDIQLSILEAFQSVGDELPRVLADMISGVDIRGLDATAAQQLAQQFAAITESATALQQAVEQLPFENLRDLSFDAAAGLIAAAGGLDNLNAGLSAYYQNFYSQGEQFAAKSKSMAIALADIGVAMPDLTGSAEEAKAAYRALVDSFDVTTESGQKAYATMIGLSGGFAELTGVMGQLAQQSKNFASEILGAFTGRDGSVDVSGLAGKLKDATEQEFVATIVQVFENLASRIANIVDSIANERRAVQDAIRQVSNLGAMTPDAIQRQIASINTMAPNNSGVVAAASRLNAADSLAQIRKREEEAARNRLLPIQAQQQAAQQRLSSAQQTLASAQARVDQLERDIHGPKTVPYKSAGWGALNAAREAAYPQIDGARGALGRAQAEMQAAQGAANAAPGKSAVDQLAAQYAAAVSASAQAQAAATAAAEKARQSQVGYADALQSFAIDAGKSVGKLSDLRQETLRYYEAQKQLADLMGASAAGLRKTASDYRFGQLDPEDQFKQMQSDFSKNYSMALSTEGEALAGYADKLNASLNPMLDAARDMFATDEQYNSFVATMLARAEAAAQRLDVLAPADYEDESLALLGQIDATLAALDASTRSAEQIMVDAINASRDAMVNGLRQVAAALTGQPVAAFATGGYHVGGLRIVGENGPELEATGPSRIFSASQTQAILSGGSGNAELAAEVRALRQEVAKLHAAAQATAGNTGKIARQGDRIEIDGMLVRTDADTPIQVVVTA